jgi:hypothetical protein
MTAYRERSRPSLPQNKFLDESLTGLKIYEHPRGLIMTKYQVSGSYSNPHGELSTNVYLGIGMITQSIHYTCPPWPQKPGG